jgi:hypothetical protein
VKIIQIISAQGWWAVYDAIPEKEVVDFPILTHQQLFAFGVTDEGEVEPLVWEGRGYDSASSVSNFIGLTNRNGGFPSEFATNDEFINYWRARKIALLRHYGIKIEGN